MSSTTTSPTPPTSDVPAPVPSFNSIFQSPGGPPLILVCIAAGLLLGAFLGILLMRRMRPTVAVQRTLGLRGFPDPVKKLGEKPKLLDVHVVARAEAAGVRGAGGGWGDVYPFAALYLPSPEPSAPPAPSPPPTRAEIWRRRVLARLPAQLRPSRRSHDSHISLKAQMGDRAPPVREVQLAVIVTMPSPRPVPAPAPAPSLSPVIGKEKEKAKEAQTEQEKEKEKEDPLSVNVSPVDDRNDSPDHIPAPAPAPHVKPATNENESPVPDCCIGTLVVSYQPPPEDMQAEADASAP